MIEWDSQKEYTLPYVLKGVPIMDRKAWSREEADTYLGDYISPTQKDQRGRDGGGGEDGGGESVNPKSPTPVTCFF